MNFSRPALGLLAAATLAVAACGTASTEVSDDGPTVATSVYPVEWAAQRVMADRGRIETLAIPGADAHSVELSPRQMATLSRADLVVQLEGFQPAVDEAIGQADVDAVLQISDIVDLEPIDEGHDHDDQGHAEEDAHGDFDPHFWQDTSKMATLLTELADRLAEIDPEHADAYRANALDSVAFLDELHGEYEAGLADCVRREFITTHAAFRYLAQRYDLTEIGISGINPDAEPSPARIAEVHEEAERHGVTTIFFETTTSDAVAASVANDLALTTAVLDPLETISDTSPGTDYRSIMRANLDALRTANECS